MRSVDPAITATRKRCDFRREFSCRTSPNRSTHWPGRKGGKKNFRIARDGSPLSISLDQQGGHQIVVRCWNQELTRPPGRRQYDWRLEITVPNGGLIARKDAFEFEAPEGGYLPSDSVEMPATLGDQWRSSAERSYFVRFDDETFGRVELEMQAGGDHFVVWKSFLNPKAGSRNLETTAN